MMPCQQCEDGKWRWGETGECEYDTREECEADHEGEEDDAGPSPESQNPVGTGYGHLATRLFNTPHLIHPERARSILQVIGPRMGYDMGGQAQPPEQFRREARREVGYRVANGIGIVEIHGTMIKRAGGMDAMSGLVGYEQVEAAITEALNDRQVETLVLNIDSPGGEASGVDGLAESIYQARGRKRIVAVANDIAASAAYWIASAADEVVVPRTAEVGSIGVVMVHADMSGAMEGAGIDVTHIYAGAHKIDGTPYQPLSNQAEERFRADVDYLYGVFVETVARNRGLNESAVRGTEALTFFGPGAVRAGLADSVETLSEVLDRLSAGNNAAGGPIMASDDKAPAAEAGQAGAETKATANELAQQHPEAAASLRAEGATQERERVQAILDSDAAAGRDNLARHLAFQTDTEADKAKELLEAAPKEQAAGGADPLSTAMAGVPDPDVGPDSEAAETEADEAEAAAQGIAAGANR